MNDLKQFQNGVNEDGEVVIPFIGGVNNPGRAKKGPIKGFFWLTFWAGPVYVGFFFFFWRKFFFWVGV